MFCIIFNMGTYLERDIIECGIEHIEIIMLENRRRRYYSNRYAIKYMLQRLVLVLMRCRDDTRCHLLDTHRFQLYDVQLPVNSDGFGRRVSCDRGTRCCSRDEMRR